MSYRRVLPRDLFNEADLLKCYGALWLKLENLGPKVRAAFLEDDVPRFDIAQDMGSGAITVRSLTLMVHDREVDLYRPLNARAKWPLYASIDDEETRVFDEEGELTPEFMALIRA